MLTPNNWIRSQPTWGFVDWFSNIRYKNNTDHHPVVSGRNALLHSQGATGEIPIALPQTECVWNLEAEKYALTAMLHWDANCDKAMLLLGKHTSDIYLVLTTGRIYPSLLLAVLLSRCAKGLWRCIHGSPIWTSAPHSFIPLLPETYIQADKRLMDSTPHHWITCLGSRFYLT